MLQLLLRGFPENASQINASLSIQKKGDQIIYWVGSSSYTSHKAGDKAGLQFAVTSLIANNHVRACEISCPPMNIPHRTLMRWLRKYEEDERGPGSFYQPCAVRGGKVITPEKAVECGRLLDEGMRIPEVARRVGINESALRKAVKSGRIPREGVNAGNDVPRSRSSLPATTKSERCGLDAQNAENGLGTACARADERMAAAIGLIDKAGTRFEHCKDVSMGGLLTGLPALCGNGLLSGLNRHLSLPKGFYSALNILILLGVMALGRLRRPEALRHVPPGEMGKVLGLDRAPEVRTLREKIAVMSSTGTPMAWMKELSKTWMNADPHEAGYLYVDGHVRVYHGQGALLPRRYVSRERLCLRGTTDYWVNDAIGRPFFVVSKTLTDGLSAALLNDIVPDLLETVPNQPSPDELAADPLLHRFVMVFDREGATHSLISALWQNRIGAITYRKAVTDQWNEDQFKEIDVPVPSGGSTKMKLASKEAFLTAGEKSIPVIEVRRLTKTGHQTAIISTARRLSDPVIAGRMFSRWCQENFFAYMMQHFDIDGLVQYGSEDIPGTLLIINPAWRVLDKQCKDIRRRIQRLQAELGATTMDNENDITKKAEQMQDIQALQKDKDELCAKRRQIKRKVPLSSLPEDERPSQLLPLAKAFTDTVKMIAYRAETALVGLLRPHLAKEDEARALIRGLFVSSADIEPNDQENTLVIRVHRMASPAHDKAIAHLFDELNLSNFQHPETGARLIYKLA